METGMLTFYGQHSSRCAPGIKSYLAEKTEASFPNSVGKETPQVLKQLTLKPKSLPDSK